MSDRFLVRRLYWFRHKDPYFWRISSWAHLNRKRINVGIQLGLRVVVFRFDF